MESPPPNQPDDLWRQKVLTETFKLVCQAADKPGYDNLKLVSGSLIAMGGQGIHLVTPSTIEPLLVEKLTGRHTDNVGYLLECMVRLQDVDQNDYQKSVEKARFFEHVGQLILGYFVRVLLHPSSFNSMQTHRDVTRQFVDRLCSKAGVSSLPSGFINGITGQRFSDPETIHRIFRPVFHEIAHRTTKLSLLNSTSEPIAALKYLVSFPQLQQVLIHSPEWLLPTDNGRTLERGTMMAPFFSLSCCMRENPQVLEQLFGGNKSQSELDTSEQCVRLALNSVRSQLHETFRQLLKGGLECREAAVRFFQFLVESNAQRAQMQVNELVTSSEGLLINLAGVLLKLCEPFLTVDFKKIGLIDPEYTLCPRLDLSKETRLLATSSEIEEWAEEAREQLLTRKKGTKGEMVGEFEPSWQPEKLAQIKEEHPHLLVKPLPYSFITECFWLTLRALHVGVLKSMSQHQALVRRLAQLSQEGDDSSRLAQGNSIRVAMEASLCDTGFLEVGVRLYIFLAEWICTLVDPVHRGERLPVPQPLPRAYRAIPEFAVEDMGEFLVFVLRSQPVVLLKVPNLEKILKAIVMLLADTSLLNSTHLRSNLVEILLALAPTDTHNALSVQLAYLFEPKDDSSFMAQLGPALMALYIDIEHTGRDSQFYEKFNVRYQIACLFKYLWGIPVHKRAILCCGEKDSELAVRFINMLLNDSTYLLDEALQKLTEIHTRETEMRSPAWANMSAQERREAERSHARDEHVVRIEFLLANETVHMLSYFSAEMKSQFMRPEMVSRLAEMLNFFLVTLADPDKRKSLHVANPAKYHFNPKKLLHLIVNTYLNFANESEFIEACAKDGRSFKPAIFQAAVTLFRGFANDAAKTERFDQLVLAVISQSQSDSNIEDQLGDVPDDFLDPIMSTLMLDPVKLPTSGKVMDRAVIMRILLTEHLDPFNRAELKPGMLEADDETKERIHNFLKSKGVDPAKMGANSP